jgi:hypothetical protein
MKIVVERFLFEKDCTVGRLYIDGVMQCFTIEDEIRVVKIKGETAIPYGVYEVGTRYSPKFSPTFGHEMLWVKNVPGFQYILIHWGNTDDDTDGCLLVGNKIGIINNQTAVLNSKSTYLKIYKIISDYLETGGKVTIEYIPKSHIA